MNKFNGFLGVLCLTLFLSACNSTTFNQTEGNIAETKQKIVSARAHEDAQVKAQPPLLVKEGMYVDTTPVSLEKQPEWLKNPIIIRGDQLPFSYYSRVIASAADKAVLTKTQTGIDSTVQISMNYSGTVKGALDLLAAKTGYVYTIKHGNTIYWQAFITHTFNIAFMPGASDYVMGQTSGTALGGGGGTSGGITDASSQEFSSLKGSLSVWDDIGKTIKQLLSADGRVVVSQSTTSVTVRDRPSNVDLVGQYVRNLNKSLAQQVFIRIEVLDVALSNDFNWGIDWNLLESAFDHNQFQLNASYGTPITIKPLTGGAVPFFGLPPDRAIGQFGPSVLSAVVRALTQQGKVSIVAQPRVVCMNNQVSAIRVVDQQGYIQSVQNTAIPSTTSSSITNISTITSQITPGTLITGLTLYVLPKILGDKIFLQVNVDLSQKISVDTLCAQSGTTPGSCANSSYVIQSPHVTEKIFNQRTLLTTGETLVMSGLRQVQNQTGAMQLFNVQELGGKASTQSTDDTVILITPYVLHPRGTS